MPDEPRVQELLDELLERQATPEEVCGACQELLPVVRRRWRQICRARAELDALLPVSPLGTLPRLPPEELPLPQVPGYAVESVLGRGGMGAVYRARHLKLNRTVALKTLLAGAYAGPAERARFQREAEAVAGLSHANIVQVYEAGEHEGRPYFTMELIDGGSLARKLSGAPQPARQTAALLATLAGAVQAAHEAGVVHRDLKPGNVLLTAAGTPKVADFGLARRLDADERLTLSGAVIGTPSYTAPEQAWGDRSAVGPRTDVYSLGAILYECLTGRPPFHAGTAAATLQQVVADEPVAPRRLIPSAPRDLETVCLKCLHKEPRQRYASAAELADDLRRFEHGEPIAARRVGVVGSLRKWARRRPGAAALLGAVALEAATGAGGAGLLYQHSAHQARMDQEVRGIVDRARDLLEAGWQAHNLAKLTEAEAESNRAADIARSGGASAAVQQEAERFREDAALRLERAAKNRALLEALLDVSAPQETKIYTRDGAGRLLALAQLGANEQYAAAIRRWGLDVDGSPEGAVAEQLRPEPDAMVQKLIAGLDAWMMERRSQGRPEAEWRRLFRVADRLDRSERHRRVRELLAGGSPPPAAVAGLAGAGTPWPALWELARGTAWRGLREMRQEIDPRTEPVLTAVLLARAFAAAGDAPEAEQVLRQAATARPDQVVLLDALGKLLERQGPARLAEAAFRKSIDLRPDFATAYTNLGIALDRQQRSGAAEAAYRKAIELKPDYASAYYNLGIALMEQQKPGEAEAAFRKCIDLRPDFAQAYTNLGNILVRQGRAGAAEAALRKAVGLNPGLYVIPKPRHGSDATGPVRRDRRSAEEGRRSASHERRPSCSAPATAATVSTVCDPGRPAPGGPAGRRETGQRCGAAPARPVVSVQKAQCRCGTLLRRRVHRGTETRGGRAVGRPLHRRPRCRLGRLRPGQ